MRVSGQVQLKQMDKKDQYHEVITRDISNRGAFIETNVPFSLASELRVILDLGKYLVWAIGSVVRIEKHGVAVAFSHTELTPASA